MKWDETTIMDWRNLWGKLGQENWGPGKTTYIVSATEMAIFGKLS